MNQEIIVDIDPKGNDLKIPYEFKTGHKKYNIKKLS
jgi:hypothetical protein